MMKPSTKKNLTRWGILLIVDILIIGGWVLYEGASPSSTIVLLLFDIPLLFFANLVAAVILYFVKKYLLFLLVVNAFVSVILLCFFWNLYIDLECRIYSEGWTFEINGVEYNISYPSLKDNQDERYSVLYSGSYGSDYGIVFTRNDTIFFHSKRDSINYYIHKRYLYNFKADEYHGGARYDKIKIKKEY